MGYRRDDDWDDWDDDDRKSRKRYRRNYGDYDDEFEDSDDWGDGYRKRKYRNYEYDDEDYDYSDDFDDDDDYDYDYDDWDDDDFDDDDFWEEKGKRLPIRVSCSPEAKGIIGERVIANILSKLPDMEYKIYNDVLLEYGGKSAQIDHIVISPFGMFVIETKNYAGVILGKESEPKWIQNVNGIVNRFYNPIMQNIGHCRALEHCLGVNRNIFIPIVVFSQNCILRLQTENTVIYSSNLIEKILEYDKKILSYQDVEKLSKKLIDTKNDSYEARERHIKSIKQQGVRLGKCPQCGNRLVERNGKYGKFVGCSGYPKCKYHRKLYEVSDSSDENQQITNKIDVNQLLSELIEKLSKRQG